MEHLPSLQEALKSTPTLKIKRCNTKDLDGDLEVTEEFLNLNPELWSIKGIMDKFIFIKDNNAWLQKTQEKTKGLCSLGEIICKSYNQQRTCNLNYLNSIPSQKKESFFTNKTIYKLSILTLSKRMHAWTNKKMFNIIIL